MTLPNTIPFNANRRFFILLLVVAVIGSAASVSSLIPPLPGYFVSALFLAFTGLLLVQRLVWPRALTLTHESITVPSGFLRLRPRTVPYETITRIWVTHLPFTVVLCVRAVDRQVEIPDILLPDPATFRSLKQFLESKAP